MDSRAIRADFFMLITAAVWGFAFVAQRIGMEYVGPFTFNGVRFLLGGLSLVPFLFIRPAGADSVAGDADPARAPKAGRLKLLLYGVLAGVALFLGADRKSVV